MSVTLATLKANQRDYFLARWEEDQLILEPHCFCGNSLDEDYFCGECQRECSCDFIVCEDAQTLSVVEKLINGNPGFRDAEASLLDPSTV